MTYQEIKRNEEINTYIRHADLSLSTLGFTEHSFEHVTLCAEKAGGVHRGLSCSKTGRYLIGGQRKRYER